MKFQKENIQVLENPTFDEFITAEEIFKNSIMRIGTTQKEPLTAFFYYSGPAAVYKSELHACHPSWNHYVENLNLFREQSSKRKNVSMFTIMDCDRTPFSKKELRYIDKKEDLIEKEKKKIADKIKKENTLKTKEEKKKTEQLKKDGKPDPAEYSCYYG